MGVEKETTGATMVKNLSATPDGCSDYAWQRYNYFCDRLVDLHNTCVFAFEKKYGFRLADLERGNEFPLRMTDFAVIEVIAVLDSSTNLSRDCPMRVWTEWTFAEDLLRMIDEVNNSSRGLYNERKQKTKGS